jgi:hypothetical protein
MFSDAKCDFIGLARHRSEAADLPEQPFEHGACSRALSAERTNINGLIGAGETPRAASDQPSIDRTVKPKPAVQWAQAEPVRISCA